MKTHLRRSFRRMFYVSFIWTTIFSVTFTSMLTGIVTNVANANPLGGTVVAGSASINSSGSNLTVTQNSSRAIINWQGFSINPGETTRFIQPNSQAAILNRVTGGNPSAILGSMQSNGQVYLINPSGIVFGPGANVNVGGLVASTLNVANDQFMRGGNLNFAGNSRAGVYNYGQIRALEGDIYMIGNTVANHGVIQASNGSVGLLAGQSVTLVDGARPYLPVKANSDSISDSSVTNTGLISAVQVELANNGGNVYGLAINNKGTIRATGSVEKNGRIYLTAPGAKIDNSGNLIAKSGTNGGKVEINSGSGGKTTVSGKIDVAGNKGGEVKVLGDEVVLASASIDASGTIGGGEVLIGGDYQGQGSVHNALNTLVDLDTTINANADLTGNGGNVIVWADDSTMFNGNISATGGSLSGDGGFAEVSGKKSLGFYGLVDLSAANGDAGTVLLDPVNVTLSIFPNIGNNINVFSVANMLNAGTNVRITTNSPGAAAGDITVKNSLIFVGDGHLSLLAHRHVKVEANIISLGDGNIKLAAGWTPPGGTGMMNFGNNGGNVILNSNAAGQSLRVVSRNGNVKALGHDVILRGGSGSVILGSNNGKTVVRAKHDVIMRSGDDTVQIGSQLLPATGKIRVVAGNNIEVYANDEFGVARIGHDNSLLATGKIRVKAGKNIDVIADDYHAVAQIGHNSPYSIGKISLRAGRNINIESMGHNTIALVGHSHGLQSFEERIVPAGLIGNDLGINPFDLSVLLGNIKVKADGNVLVSAGENGNYASAQIGHNLMSYTTNAALVGGNIKVVAGKNIAVATDYDHYNNIAQIGHRAQLSGVGSNFPTATLADGLPVELDGFGDFNIEEHIGVGSIGTGMLIVGNITTRSGGNTKLVIDRDTNLSQVGHLGSIGGFNNAPAIAANAEFGESLSFNQSNNKKLVLIFGNIDMTAGGNINVNAAGYGNTSRVGHLAIVNASDSDFGGMYYPRGVQNFENTFGDANAETTAKVGVFGNIDMNAAGEINVKSSDYSLAHVGHQAELNTNAYAEASSGFPEGFGRFDNEFPIGGAGNATATTDAHVGIIGNITMSSKGEMNIKSKDSGTSNVGHRTSIYSNASAYGGSGGFPNDLVVLNEVPYPMPVGGNADANVGVNVLMIGDISLNSNRNMTVESKHGGIAQVGHDSNINVNARAIAGGGNNRGLQGMYGFGGMANAEADINVGIFGKISMNTKRNMAVLSDDYSTSHIGHHSAIRTSITQRGSMPYIILSDEINEVPYRISRSGSRVKIIGDIVMTAKKNIDVISKGYDSVSHVGHASSLASSPMNGQEPAFTLLGENDFGRRSPDSVFILGDIKIGTKVGDITFRANRGRTQIGHRSVRLMNRYQDDIGLAIFDEGEGEGRPQGRPFGKTIGDIIVIAGGDGDPTNRGNINVIGRRGEVHVGHFGHGLYSKKLTSHIVMVADNNFTIAGNRKYRALIGHKGKHHQGAVVLAWDQIDPESDNNGRFFMNRFSTIRSGWKNAAILIGTRRGPFNGPPALTGDGLPVNIIEDGAVINHVRFDSSLPLGTRLNHRWNINTEFQNWEAEQWGVSFFDIVNNPDLFDLFNSGKLKLNLSTLQNTYTHPFTFYYLEGLKIPPPINDYNVLRELPSLPNGVGGGTSGYGEDDREKEGETTGDNSANVFQP